jgi:predicted amidohydrolase
MITPFSAGAPRRTLFPCIHGFAAMNRPFQIAAVQSTITPDIRENGRHIRSLMRLGKEAGARLLHFPEGALSGYVKSQIASWDRVDWIALSDELRETAALAKNLGIWMVLGCAHRLTAPHSPHNSLYIISDQGELIGRYDKRRCSNSEINHWYSPGFEPVTFQIDGFVFGCALCIEVCFPEMFAEYERLGVDCLLLSSYSENLMFGVMAQGHAATNCYWISISVPAQCGYALPASLIGPNGDYIAQCRRISQPDIALARLDRDAPEFDIPLNKARPWRAAARKGEIYAVKRVDDLRSRNRTEF